jgi:phosphatidylglycerol:prolipoprotein diacylglycerol transferase
MRPVLFSLGHDHPLAFHAYGFCVTLGLLVGIWILVSEVCRLGLDLRQFAWMMVWCAVVGFVGARLVFVLVNAPTFVRTCLGGEGATRTGGRLLADCTLALHVWGPGLVIYGGLIGGTLAGIVFARARGWPCWRLADVFAPATAAGMAIGRLGCLAAGCCFGKPTDLPWGIAFPAGSIPAAYFRSRGAPSPPLHPTQAYEAAGLLALTALLLYLRWRQHRPGVASRPGARALVFLVGYGALRFADEWFRGDVERGFLFEWRSSSIASWLHVPVKMPLLFSTSQLVSVVIIAAAIVLASLRRRTARLSEVATSIPPAVTAANAA